jgi:hypothetical protein
VIYSPSVFATAYVCANMRTYALHCAASSWYKQGKTSFAMKLYEYLIFNFRFFAMLHWWWKKISPNSK